LVYHLESTCPVEGR